MQWIPGTRLKSVVGATEIVVVRPPGAPDAVLLCGGRPMVAYDADVSREEAVLEGHDGSTMLGKRYGLDEDPLEILVTKTGPGALSLGPVMLTAKDAKPLPSSD